MSDDSVVVDVIRRLDSAGVPYMLVGSYASSVWGRPRSSYDADIVANLTASDVPRILGAFQDAYVLEPEALRGDLERGRMFNLIPRSGVFKVDIIPLRTDPHAAMEFSRRRRIHALGTELWVASPKDTLLYKLSWYRQGEEISGRQVEDAADIYRAQSADLDQAYLDHWSEHLKIRDLLDRVRRQGGRIAP